MIVSVARKGLKRLRNGRVAAAILHAESYARLEAGPWAAAAGGSLRLDPHPTDRSAVAQAPRLFGARLSGRRRLYGSRQLGDLARGRLQVRLRAADRRASVQHDGDPVAGALHATWCRRR